MKASGGGGGRERRAARLERGSCSAAATARVCAHASGAARPPSLREGRKTPPPPRSSLFARMHGWRGRVPDSSAQHNTRSSRHIARARRRPHLLLSSSLSLSLSRFLSLSLWQGGAVYDLCNAVPFVREHGVDPATGAPLKASELVRLTFHRDGNGELGCPVSGEPFTDSTKTCAVRTTGNVYSYKVVEELNLRPKSLRDLLTDEPFKRADVLVLRPQNEKLESSSVSAFIAARQAAPLPPIVRSGCVEVRAL